MITNVILWQNGMVMVFDEQGQQISEYQGRHENVRDLIISNAPADAHFFRGEWARGDKTPMTRADFAAWK